MVRHVLTIVLLALTASFGYSQTRNHSSDIGITIGTNVALGEDDSDSVIGLTYGHFYSNGLGFRTGFQYIPSVMGIDNSFGVPVAFAFRTPGRDTGKRFESAGHAASKTLERYRDYYDGTSFTDVIASFLFNLFSQAEFHAGITPGYVSGERKSGISRDSRTAWWTEKPCSTSLSLDAGASLNFRIWRFDLKVIPCFHYNVTDNYEIHKAHIDPSNGKLVGETSSVQRWFFSISGGVSFLF